MLRALRVACGWQVGVGIRVLRATAARTAARPSTRSTGTLLAQLHRRDAWLAYAHALVDGVSLRKAAERSALRSTPRSAGATAFSPPPKTRGRRKSRASWRRTRPSSASRAKDSSGSRPRSRKREHEQIRPVQRDYAPVLVVRDRHGATLDHMLPDLEGATFKRILKPVVAS